VVAGDSLVREAKALGYADVDAMLRAIGEHQVSGRSIAQRISRALRKGEDDEVLPSSVRAPSRMRRATPTSRPMHLQALSTSVSEENE